MTHKVFKGLLLGMLLAAPHIYMSLAAEGAPMSTTISASLHFDAVSHRLFESDQSVSIDLEANKSEFYYPPLKQDVHGHCAHADGVTVFVMHHRDYPLRKDALNAVVVYEVINGGCETSEGGRFSQIDMMLVGKAVLEMHSPTLKHPKNHVG